MQSDSNPPDLGEMEQPTADADSPSRTLSGAPIQVPAFSGELSTEPGTIQFLSNIATLDTIEQAVSSFLPLSSL